MLISTFRSGNFEISIYKSLNVDLAEKWNSLNSDSLNTTYLKFLEESNPVDLNFLYIIVEELKESRRETCAILYFQILKFSKKNIDFKNSFFLNLVTTLIFKLQSFKILISGNLFAVNFPAINTKLNLPPEKLYEIISELERRINPDIFILKDLINPLLLSEIKKHNWIPYPADLTMTLKIKQEWKTFEDYIKSLSKKYKKRSEKIIFSGQKIIRKNLGEIEIKERSEEIEKLFLQVSEKQTVRMGLINGDYFYLYKKNFPDIFSMEGYFYEDKLIGFASFIEHGSELEIHYIGIDYSHNKELMIYFNILFDGLRKAIESGKQFLELGRTAREAKANLGAEPVYFNDYLRIKKRFTSFLIKKFSKYFQSELGEKWMNKHPFRK